MQLHNLKKNRANRQAKKVGRGGTRGKTSGRGTKGQNARSGRKKRPEMRDFIKKLPKLRGRGKNFLKSRQAKPKAVNLALLEKSFGKGEVVTRISLLDKNLIQKRSGKIEKAKILGVGALTKALTIEGISVSKGARKVIEFAGGKIV